MPNKNSPNLLLGRQVSETATIESQEKKTKPKRTTNDYHKYLAGRSYQLFKRGIKSVRILDFYRLGLCHFCPYAEMSTEELVAKFCPYIKDSEGMHVPNINGQIQLQRVVENFILDLHERGGTTAFVYNGRIFCQECYFEMLHSNEPNLTGRRFSQLLR